MVILGAVSDVITEIVLFGDILCGRALRKVNLGTLSNYGHLRDFILPIHVDV